MEKDIVKGHLDLLLLSVLRLGPAHGYGIIEELRRRSDGTFDFAEGTIYPALHALEHDGLLTSRWETEAGRRRRVYSITRRGRRELGERQATWHRFVRGVSAVVEGT